MLRRSGRSYTWSGTRVREQAATKYWLLYPNACTDREEGTYAKKTDPGSTSCSTADSSIDCTETTNCVTPYDQNAPKLWHIESTSTPMAQRPPTMTGMRFLWCGKYDTTILKAGYPDDQYQILFIDTGSTSASPITLSFQMNSSCNPDNTGGGMDNVYLVGATDTTGIGNCGRRMDEVIALNGDFANSARLLATWTGSIRSGGAFTVTGMNPPAVLPGVSTAGPATVTCSFTMDGNLRFLYFAFRTVTPRSSFDAITARWTFGTGLSLDQVSASHVGLIYSEEPPPAPAPDSYGGTVLKGPSTAPVISARVASLSSPPCPASTCYTVAAAVALPTPDACTPPAAGDSVFVLADPTTFHTVPYTTGFEICTLPVPAGTGELVASWDNYLDLPRGSGYAQLVEYRFFRNGAWSEWRNTSPSGSVRTGALQAWVTEADELPEAVTADSVHLRYKLHCDPSNVIGGVCPSLTYGVLYDNLSLIAVTGIPPLTIFGVFPASLAQTTFVDGTMMGTNCSGLPCWPGVRGSGLVDPLAPALAIHDNVNSPEGDSIVVSLHSPLRTNGKGINWRHGFDKTVNEGLTIAHTNPTWSPAADFPRVIYRLFDPATRTWSPWDSTELDADDVFAGTADTILIGSSFRFDWPPRDKAGMNLPGSFTINGIAAYSSLSFLPRGARFQYYLKAVDINGAVAYQFQGDAPAREVEDLPTLPGSAIRAPDIIEFDVLPRVYPSGTGGSLLAGKTNTPILNLDGAYTAWTLGQDPMTQALRGLGVRTDRYRLLQGIDYGNNIGGHELAGQPTLRAGNYFPNMDEYAIKDSLAAWYRIMLVSSHLRTSTILDEQDARLIREWSQASTGADGGDRCVFASGDDFFRSLLAVGGFPKPHQNQLATEGFGVAAASSWNGTATNHVPNIRDRFSDPSAGPSLGVPGDFVYTADGACPGPNRFDALTIVGAEARIVAHYPGTSDNTAAMARMTEWDGVSDNDRTKSIGYGYSIQFVIQQRMKVLYKFLTSCRGARTATPADTGKCWPCPSDTNMTGNWLLLPGFQTATYGPLYPIQDPLLVTGVGDNPAPGSAPYVSALFQNRPNPFNPETIIPYSLATPGRVVIRIYDIAGRCIRTLIDDSKPAGSHTVRWNGDTDGKGKAASGVYFFRITYPNGATSAKKLSILR